MRLTTRGRYAVTALLDIAIHQGDGPVTLADVSARQGISQAYLEQLFGKLRRAGLVRGVRGPGGGFRLDRDADAIDLAAIVASVDERLEATRCDGAGNCQNGEVCLTHAVWSDLSARVHEYLVSTTLGSLARREEVVRIARRQHGAPPQDTDRSLIAARSV